MSRIESFNQVREYPDKVGDYRTLTITNHWSDKEKVILTFGEEKLIFFARDIQLAIENATNTH